MHVLSVTIIRSICIVNQRLQANNCKSKKFITGLLLQLLKIKINNRILISFQDYKTQG